MKKGWLDKYSEIADGGTTISGPTILSRQDPAYKSYQDSLNLYNQSEQSRKVVEKNFDWIRHGPTLTEEQIMYVLNKKNARQEDLEGASGRMQYGKFNIYKGGKSKDAYVSGQWDHQDQIGEYRNKNIPIRPIGWKPELTYGYEYTPGELYDYDAVYKKPTNPPTIAQILKLKSKGITSTEKKLIPRETPQFSKPIDKSLVRTEKQWLNKNTYNGESEGDYLLNFYDDDSVEKTPYKKMQTGGKKEKISTSIPYEKYNQKNITPKQALTQEALQYIFGNPSENYNPQPIEQVPNDATNRQPYISKQQAEQISKDVRNPYYGSPNYHVPVKEYSISPDKQENKMDNELAERIKKEEEKHTQWDRIHYGSKTAINLANMFTAGKIPPLAYSAGAMDAWDAGMDYSEGNYTGAMNNATGALLNILPQTLGLNTRSFTPSTNSYATARWWKNNPSALVAPTTITPNLIDYANRGLGLSTQYVNPALNAFVNNKLNIRGVQTPITGKLASDIGLSVDDAYKTIHKNGGEVNYNNSNVSLPEGFVGMGNDTSGRNYSPAWGGQFQDGGWTSKYISEDKFLQPNSEKLPWGYKIPNRDPSSELAMSIGGEDGEPAYLIPSFKYGQPLEDPLKEYRETGDYLGGPFKTWQEADDWDINVRHPYVEKNQAIPFPIRTKGKDMQMGGVLPSAFVRTGDIPSEGKYVKKTIPSAQTGLISHPGGNRNINTNQVTISPRQEYENIQAEKKKQSELFNYIQKNNEIQKARSDIYTDPQTGKQVIQNIGIKPSASPIDAAVLGVGALYSGGMGLLGSMANMLSPVPLPSKNILSNIYKRFPLTNNAKIKLIEEQDKAFQTENAFTEAWATHPVTKEKINNILNTRKGNYIQHDLDTPFYNYNNVLVDTKNYNPYDFPGNVADLLNKGERKFAGFNDPQGYSVTLRNGIIGKVPAKEIGEIAVHEGGHTMQHMGGDPANYYHGGWHNEITAYNPKTNYYSANLDTDLGRYFGKNMKTPNKFHSWEASPDELHADLMTARFKANITPDTELTDKVVDNLIKQGNLNKFFKYGVSKNIKRDMIRMLPVVTGVALLKNKPQDESSYASGGQIKTDNRGYWNPKNWGHPVRINSNDITMEGVDQPLWGISDTGDTKYMEPGQDYRFKGKSVTEYPMARNGINNLDEKTTEHLDQLTNFTNKQNKKWLEKYN